jgi:hypothetical protein
MKGVAISQLPRCFVLCRLRINGVWERIEEYAEIEDPANGMHNISKGGFFTLTYRYDDQGQDFMKKAKDPTMQVCASCPFGLAMGVEGRGEGIVWTPSTGSILPNRPDLWLKTKGEEFFAAFYVPKLRQPGSAEGKADQRPVAKVFAENYFTERRCEQGVEYLEEMGLERTMRNIREFLNWVTSDIEVEEKKEIEELKLGKKGWSDEVVYLAKAWFKERVGV